MFTKSKLSFSDYYSIDTISNKDKKKEKKIVEQKKNNQKKHINTFPMAWTCYKLENGKWKCPLNGD